MSPKIQALEKYLSANGGTVRLVTFTTGPRLVVSSPAQLRAALSRFNAALSSHRKGGQK